jgi:hypothetical protein
MAHSPADRPARRQPAAKDPNPTVEKRANEQQTDFKAPQESHQQSHSTDRRKVTKGEHCIIVGRIDGPISDATFQAQYPQQKGVFDEKKSQLSEFHDPKRQTFLCKRRLAVVPNVRAIAALPQQLKLEMFCCC